MKFSDAIIKYGAFCKLKNKSSSYDTYMKNIRQLALYFRDGEIENTRLQEVIDYMDLMVKLGMERNSLVGKASSFKQFFSFFHKQGIIKFDPDGIPVPRYEAKFPKIIEESDFNKILKTIKTTKFPFRRLRAKAFWLFLWDTGTRLNELRNIKVKDLDLKKNVLYDKNRKKQRDYSY